VGPQVHGDELCNWMKGYQIRCVGESNTTIKDNRVASERGYFAQPYPVEPWIPRSCIHE